MLYKICFSVLLIFGLNQMANAQWRLGETVDNAYSTISISAGLAAPESQYKGRPNFDRAGFASAGLTVQVDMNFALLGNIGLTTSLSGIRNPINETLFINQQLKTFTGFSDLGGTFAADPWQHLVLSVGPSLSFPEELAVLELKLLLSGIYSQAGKVSYRQDFNYYNLDRSDAFTIGADIRAGVHFRIAEPFRLVGEARYFISAPEFDYSEDGGSQISQTAVTYSRQQRVNFFTLTLGVAYEL